MKEKPELYRETIINALIERMTDYGISPNQLDEETRKLLRGEITDVNKFKELKDKAIKTVGTKGVETKWTSLMNQAKALLEKAKNGVTEQIKKDLKTVQVQLKSFKSGTNSYLTSFYQANSSEISKLETELKKSNSSQDQQSNNSGFFQPKVIVPIVVFLVLATMITLLVIKSRKRKQVKG